MLHFIRPEWLLSLPLVPFLLAYLWRVQRSASVWNNYIASHLSRLLVSPATATRKKSLVWLASMLLISILALSGPAITKEATPVFAANQGRVIVLDMSNSLFADDLTPNRLAQEKFRATDLIKAFTQGDTALVAYAGDAFTISPLTSDKQTLLNLLPTLTPEIMPVQGSNIASGIALAQQLLKQAGYQDGDIIVFSDGINREQYEQAQRVLSGSHNRLAVMAIGTEAGAAIRFPDGQLQKDNQGAVIIAKTDMGLLAKLAAANDGLFVPMSVNGADVQQVIDWSKVTHNAKLTDIQGEQWQDLGPYIALLLLLPVLLTFRHGILANAVFACLLLTSSVIAPKAQASSWDDLWHTQDQQAQASYAKGQYQQAADTFTDAKWRGAALYQAKEYEQALAEFSKDNSANGLYNQGHALMQLEQYEAAKERYQQAIQLAPDFTEAKQNLALAEKLLHQQQQQEQEQQQQQDSQSGESGQDQQQNNQGEDSQQNQESSSAEQSNEPSGQPNSGSNSDSNQASKQSSSQSEANQEASSEREQPTPADDTATPAHQDADKSQSQGGNDAQSDEKSEQASASNLNEPKPDESNSSEPKQDESTPDESKPNDSDEQQHEPSNQAPMLADPNDSQAKSPTNGDTSYGKETEATHDKSQPSSADELAAGNSQAAQSAANEAAGNTEGATAGMPSATTDPQRPPLPAEMQRMLNAVSDNPQILLRNKMQLEYQKRQMQGNTNKEAQQW